MPDIFDTLSTDQKEGDIFDKIASPSQGDIFDKISTDSGESGTPETTKALSEAGVSGFMRGLSLGTLPRDVTETLTPLIGAVTDIKREYNVLRDVVSGQKTWAQATQEQFPETQTLVGIEKKPLRERIATGLDVATQLAFLKAGGEAIPRGGEQYAKQPSYAQVQEGDIALGEQARPEGEIPKPSDSDYAQREAQGAAGEGPQPVPTGEPVAPTAQEGTYGKRYGIDIHGNVVEIQPGDITMPIKPGEQLVQIRGTPLSEPAPGAGVGDVAEPAAVQPPAEVPVKHGEFAKEGYTAIDSSPVGGPSIRAVAERPIEAPPPGTIRGWEEATAHGENWLNRGGDINKVVTDFRKTGKVNELEMGKMNAYLNRLQSVTNQAGDALIKSPNDPKLKQAYQQALAREQAFTNAYKPMHTVASGSLAALQGHVPLTEQAAASFTGLTRRFAEFKGRPASPEEAVKADRLSKKMDKANGDYAKSNGDLYKTIDNEYGRIRTTRKGPPTFEDLGKIFGETLNEVCDV